MDIYRALLKRLTKSKANASILPMSDEALRNDGNVPVKTLEVDSAAFASWVHDYFPNYLETFGTLEHKKLLELYCSFSLLDIQKDHVYMDAAGGKFSYVGKIPASRRIMQDIDFAQEVLDSAAPDVEFIKCSAADVKLADSSVDRISCHHSIEHFQQNADQDFVRELQRILRPGGKAVIIPIFISDKHYLITDKPKFNFWQEEGVKVIDRLAGLPGGERSGNFSRVYSLASLKTRLIDGIDPDRFDFKLVQVKYKGKSVPDETTFYNPNQASMNFFYRALEITRIG